MGKNRTFKNVYVITFSGVTTNGFRAEILDSAIKGFIEAVNMTFEKTFAELSVTETKGDFDAKVRKFKGSE